ncbi:ROK family protein [Rhizobium sp. LEGMi198b]|uniref:ROK family transcriptional regulator n=1 Tax=unclassified Rhizobium TaxID=2613769 RepID=UPI000CDF2E90|nr:MULTISPECIES: ROK family transcriptional regulator [Rhizobium]AVA22446.1 ROK family transcriptional regulator protein [Rhizobium sp. NXC24]MDK4738498.1 ROK family transcriptional regulator [Rhizobium sp. CNPSo 3464]UWU19879.1 ROK family transcriptional regulator [Rhizobium tropici]WFU00666.1 ROK family transcriptional regulator [Rhizobium sp. CB3171]
MLAKSSTELVRQKNSVLVLTALRRHGPLAHTELSDFTKLSSATISVITTDLERAQIIEKAEQQAAGGRGRPRVLFSQRRDCGYLIVVIISSDAVQYSLVDYAGRLIDRFTEARQQNVSGAGSFVIGLRDALNRIVARSRLPRDKVLMISISSKGLVESSEPVLRWSPIFGREQIDFAAVLRDEWSAKIILGNETQLVAAAVGRQEENKKGRDFRALAALSLGHSIGLGIVRRGEEGKHEISAPNFGHMLHMSGGGLCRCGSRGCIEAYAGFYAILRAAFDVPLDTIPAKFVPIAELDKIAASARQGSRRNIHAFRQAGLALGNGLSRVLSLHESMPIAITGPGTRYYDLLLEGISEGLAESHVVRMEGMPELRVVADEPTLVFEGHLNRALAMMDDDIVRSGVAVTELHGQTG